MSIDVTFNAGLAGDEWAHQKILLVLVHGGAGASDGERVIGGTRTVTVGDTVTLDDNDVLEPAGTFYRATMPALSPPVVRHFRLASDTPSPVSWADPAIWVDAPVPPSFAVSVDGAIADAAAALADAAAAVAAAETADSAATQAASDAAAATAAAEAAAISAEAAAVIAVPGEDGVPGAIPPSTLALRPLASTVADGVSHLTTDVLDGTPYVADGDEWRKASLGVAETGGYELQPARPTSIAALNLAVVNTYYNIPELTTAPFTMPARPMEVRTSVELRYGAPNFVNPGTPVEFAFRYRVNGGSWLILQVAVPAFKVTPVTPFWIGTADGLWCSLPGAGATIAAGASVEVALAAKKTTVAALSIFLDLPNGIKAEVVPVVH